MMQVTGRPAMTDADAKSKAIELVCRGRRHHSSSGGKPIFQMVHARKLVVSVIVSAQCN